MTVSPLSAHITKAKGPKGALTLASTIIGLGCPASAGSTGVPTSI